jgi:hypothetical protein
MSPQASCYPRPRLAAACRKEPEILDRLFAALCEIAAGLAHGGRSYGGGLYKIEPRELAAMEFPDCVQQHDYLRVAEARPLDLFAAAESMGSA